MVYCRDDAHFFFTNLRLVVRRLRCVHSAVFFVLSLPDRFVGNVLRHAFGM